MKRENISYLTPGEKELFQESGGGVYLGVLADKYIWRSGLAIRIYFPEINK